MVLMGNRCFDCKYNCDGCTSSPEQCDNYKGVKRINKPSCICEDGFFDDGSNSDC